MEVTTPPFRVRYAETDAQGVAYYASYFGWWEVGEVHFFESLGLDIPEMDRSGRLLTVAESYARFIRPARYDDLLVVRIRLSQAAAKRFLFETALVRCDDDQVLATGRLADVVASPSGEVLPLPEQLVAAAERRVERIVACERVEELLGNDPPGAPRDTQELRVRYAETDAQGVAYYASHYVWFEAGRNGLTRAVGMPYSEMERQGHCLPVAEAYCRYLAPLRPTERFVVATTSRAITRARLAFINRLSRPDGTPVAEGFTIHAYTDGSGRPRPLPEEILERFSPTTT